MKKLLIVLIVCFCYCSYAQNNSWHYLWGGTSVNTKRVDDVYFLNKQLGFSLGVNIFKTTDGGKTWVNKTNFDTSGYVGLRSVEFLDDGKTGIVGSLSGLVYRTDDSGETWQDISFNVHGSANISGVCGLAHFGNTFFGVGWYGGPVARFYKSLDRGITWTVTILDTNLVTQLVDVAFVSSRTGFVSGGRERTVKARSASTILKTTDGGATWTRVFYDTVIGGRIWKLQFMDNQLAFASIERNYLDTVAILKSVDGGDNWQIKGIIGGIKGFTQTVGFVTPTRGWVGGTYSGLYETTDGGTTWNKINIGANFNRFFRLDSNDIVASGAGVFRYGDSTKFSTPISFQPVNDGISFTRVYPNPTSGKITIGISLKLFTHVILKVIDINGRQTYPVSSQLLRPGHYQYEWDASHLPDGQYVIWLDNDLAPVTQKFTVKH